MSSTQRQNKLLLAEDWKKIYQSFSNADFQSYDFENLRRVMINYLRNNYPEDFNDYVESSEYVALIDLIAFLGQNLSFRIDLNARENFLELAERRESILRLARLISYNPKRIQPSHGYLKIESVSTTESVVDTNGVNLAGQTVLWNDDTNPSWNEQFIKVLNAALPVNGTIGRPNKKDIVEGLSVEQYKFSSINTDIPLYGFSKSIGGRTTYFEIISSDISDGKVIEEMPIPGNNFSMLYKDDGQGFTSSNTGFFVYFRQGRLENADFSITQPSTSQVVAIDTPNINNSDIWLYKLDNLGNESEIWTKVDSIEGNNIVYNSLSKNIRNIYSVLTRVDDRVSLVFSDGVFGELPKGNFKVYFRVSDNRSYLITPSDMTGISFSIPYQSKTGTRETLTLTVELKYSINNASPSESNDSIRANAPAMYYSQNRMVTGEDYSIVPLAVSQEIIKIKSVNRTSSGISRYFDLLDATGKYSKTNLFGTDGVLYTEVYNIVQKFSFDTITDIQAVLRNQVQASIKDYKLRNFYNSHFPRLKTSDIYWNLETSATNISTGYFNDLRGGITSEVYILENQVINGEYDLGQTGDFIVNILENKDVEYWVKLENEQQEQRWNLINSEFKAQLGSYASDSVLSALVPGAMAKFKAPNNWYFDKHGNLTTITKGNTQYKWTKVVEVDLDGTVSQNSIQGPVTFNDVIPSGSCLVEVIPLFSTVLDENIIDDIVEQVSNYRVFGLRYDTDNHRWLIITDDNLKINTNFSLDNQGDSSDTNQDASWLLLFQAQGLNYKFVQRAQRYIFESDSQIKFYYDQDNKVYDPKLNQIVRDSINILSVNTAVDQTGEYSSYPLERSVDWKITKQYTDLKGYIDTRKVEVNFFDSDDDGVVDDPDVFDHIVSDNTDIKWIFSKRYLLDTDAETFKYVNAETENIQVISDDELSGIIDSVSKGFIIPPQQIFYNHTKNIFQYYDSESDSFRISVDYKAYRGRDQLSFRYEHAADENNRIDPSRSNIIDIYVMTRTYDLEFRKWLSGVISEKPLPMSSDALHMNFGEEINKLKSISDETILHPAKYKILFGENADDNLKAVFKVVKNTNIVSSDNDIKVGVISAINEYFAPDNWDFGDVFYFVELASFIMKKLESSILSVVIVPLQENLSFGSLFEINSAPDEIFISSATVDDVEIISSITAEKLQSQGTVFSGEVTASDQIQSSEV